MKKIVFLTAAAMLWGCGGAADEMQDTQEQEAGQQKDALCECQDPILGNWAYGQGTDYKVTVYTSGNGNQVSNDCFNGTLMWKGITYQGMSADGASKIYSGSTGANGSYSSCTYTAWNPVRFQSSVDGRNLRLVYSSSYSEAWIRW